MILVTYYPYPLPTSIYRRQHFQNAIPTLLYFLDMPNLNPEHKQYAIIDYKAVCKFYVDNVSMFVEQS